MRSLLLGFLGGLLAVALLGAATHSTGVSIPASTASPGYIEFYEDLDNGGNKITIIAPANITTDVTCTLPVATGDLTCS